MCSVDFIRRCPTQSHISAVFLRRSNACAKLFAAHHLLLLSLQLLLGQLLLGGLVVGNLGHRVFLLQQHHLNVARRRHVGIDATVRTVGAATQAGSAVHLDGAKRDEQCCGLVSSRHS